MNETGETWQSPRIRRVALGLVTAVVLLVAGPDASATVQAFVSSDRPTSAVNERDGVEEASPSLVVAKWAEVAPSRHFFADTQRGLTAIDGVAKNASAPWRKQLGKSLTGAGEVQGSEVRRKPSPTTTAAPAKAPTTTKAPTTKAPTTTTKAPTTKAPTAPTAPTGTIINVVDFGAKAGDGKDDQAAIAAALAAAPPNSTVVFAPGTYQHSGVITVRTAGVTLWGYGATLEGTDSDNHAVVLRADTTAVRGFTIINHPSVRKHAIEQMGIAMIDTTGSEVRDNIVRGTSSAGIYIEGSATYKVLQNTVENTMSDGIHSMGGSSYGLVEGNTLRNVGDDCFAVISYIGAPLTHDITVRNNSCVGGRARGASVVGGSNVLIQGNTIEASGAAGIYLASEPSYNTYAAKNVRVIGNLLRGVNVDPAVRHGAVFIWGRSGAAPLPNGGTSTLQNEDLLIEGNTISGTVGGAADVVAQGEFSSRVNVVGNTTAGPLRFSYVELAGPNYNVVGNTNDGQPVADHVGNAATLP